VTRPETTGRRIISRAELLKKVPLTYVAIWKKMVAGTFPRPIEISERKNGWFEDEVDAYLSARPRRRYKGDAQREATA
jgi:predicted DNA-binding transcriptional regulator AlpA